MPGSFSSTSFSSTSFSTDSVVAAVATLPVGGGLRRGRRRREPGVLRDAATTRSLYQTEYEATLRRIENRKRERLLLALLLIEEE